MQIKENIAKLADLNANIEDNESRINAMLIHMKNIKQELLHTQVIKMNIEQYSII